LGSFGQLGYGNVNSIGDDEHPSAAGSVSLGGTAEQVIAGGFHTCAVLTTGAVRCWGANTAGQLGLSTSIFAVGDDELPSSQPVVAVGGVVESVALGEQHTCARIGANVKCWGYGAYGQLGYRNALSVSNPASVGMVNVGADVQTVSAGGNQTCVLTTDLGVRCWGEGLWGPLGYGNQNNVGITQHPAAVGDLSLGGDAISISAGYDHTCAVVNASSAMHVRCWGHNAGGVLGRGTSGHLGDDELPSSVPFVIVE
jgi:alpha-tubulin suppressor-like RCC1 family protein